MTDELAQLSREAKKIGLIQAQNIILGLAVKRDQSGGISDELRSFALRAKDEIEAAITELGA